MLNQKNTGIVYKSTGSWYLVKHNNDLIQCKIRGKLRTHGFRTTNPVAVGDNVEFVVQKDGVGIILNLIDRKNCIIRQSTNLSKKNHIIAANVNQALLIVSLNSPATPIEFIDRFLVSSEVYQVPAKIVFNKTDIYTEEDNKQLDNLVDTYTEIGYECFKISVAERKNIDQIKNILKDKTSVLIGNSGVGKSSLINLINPGHALKVKEISDKYKTGKHTTTFAEMFDLETGGRIVDTPGIRAFGLGFLENEDVAHNFPEMFNLLQKCKYHNCLHIDEPKCAVKEAFEDGQIAYSRYKSYINIMLEEDEKYRKDMYQ